MRRFLTIAFLLLAPGNLLAQVTGRSYGGASPNAGSVNVGVNVNPQTGDYTLVCTTSANTDRFGEIEFNLTAAHTVTVPQAGGNACTQQGWGFVLRNTSASTAILTVANQSVSCSGSCSLFEPEAVSTKTILPGAALFVYSDAITSVGNYHAIPIPKAPGGVNIQTSSYTMTTLDKEKLVIMNCTASCTLTMPATPPTSDWFVHAISVGSNTATVSLNSLQLNGSSTVPTLNSTNVFTWFTNGSNYFGDVSFGSGASGCTISGSQYQIVSVNSGGTGCTPSNITTDSTLNDLIIPGYIQQGTAFSTGTITLGDLATFTASNTVGNATAVGSFIGVFSVTTGYISTMGKVTVNLDSTVTVTHGDVICQSGSSPALGHDNASAACPSGLTVGYVATDATSVASATVLLSRF